jgi:hypothetical protein
MNEIIKDYIHQTNCKIVVNSYKRYQHMSFVNKWMKCYLGISIATLECVWEFNVEISYKEVVYSCM